MSHYLSENPGQCKYSPKFTNKNEYLIAELNKGNIKLSVAVTYRRPFSLFPHALFEILFDLTSRYHYIIIILDFNANILSPSKPETSILIDLIKNHAFSIISTGSTHHITYSDRPSHTRLDLFVVNHIENVIHFSKSTSPFIAGHDYIHFTLNIETPKPLHKTIVCHNLNSVNASHLHQLLSSHLSPTVCASDIVSDINLHEQALSSAIFNSFQQIAPLRSIPQLKQQMNLRGKTFKL